MRNKHELTETLRNVERDHCLGSGCHRTRTDECKGCAIDTMLNEHGMCSVQVESIDSSYC